MALRSLATGIVVLGVVFSLVTVPPLIADDDFRITPDVVYGHKAGMALTYDVIQPTTDGNGAAVLFIASGGWFSHWTQPERFVSTEAPDGYKHFRDLLEKGFTLVIVRHGSAPYFKVPDAVRDVRRALRHFKQKAEEFRVDGTRIGVTGGSAGGHLSLMLGTTSDEGDKDAKDELSRMSNRVAAVVAYFPPVDLRDWVGPSRRFPALDFDKEDADAVSPLLYVTPDDAPTLLIHGDQDQLVKLHHSQQIHDAFQRENVVSELIVIKDAGHGFGGEKGERASAALVGWFVEHLASSGPQHWSGEWQSAGKGGHGGELKCVATQVAGRRWRATFTGYCDKRFVYKIAMAGTKAGDQVDFSGEADLGDEDGGVYQWTGQLKGESFAGKYESASGKSGEFTMRRVDSNSTAVGAP